jgi:hypothetical protein
MSKRIALSDDEGSSESDANGEHVNVSDFEVDDYSQGATDGMGGRSRVELWSVRTERNRSDFQSGSSRYGQQEACRQHILEGSTHNFHHAGHNDEMTERRQRAAEHRYRSVERRQGLPERGRQTLIHSGRQSIEAASTEPGSHSPGASDSSTFGASADKPDSGNDGVVVRPSQHQQRRLSQFWTSLDSDWHQDDQQVHDTVQSDGLFEVVDRGWEIYEAERAHQEEIDKVAAEHEAQLQAAETQHEALLEAAEMRHRQRMEQARNLSRSGPTVLHGNGAPITAAASTRPPPVQHSAK